MLKFILPGRVFSFFLVLKLNRLFTHEKYTCFT